MRFQVDDTCVGCGLCAGTCPGVFSLTEEGTAAAAEADVDGKDLEEARNAMEECPVGAIHEQQE